MKDIRPIRTEADYEWALGEVAQYFDEEPKKGTSQGARFEVLLGAIEAYEANLNFPTEPSTRMARQK